MRTPLTMFSCAMLCGLAAIANGQAPERGQPGGPGGPGGFGPPGGGLPPVMRVLDADGDGVISASEIEKAVAALKTLDRNGDGKLTQEELRPGFGGEGGFGGRGGPQGGPPGREGGPGEPAPAPEEIVGRWLALDRNDDGKLTADEVPERMQGLLTRADADNDGVVTKAELTALARRQAAGGRQGFGAGPGGPGGPPEGQPGGFGRPGGPGEQPGGFGRPGGPGEQPGGFGPRNIEAFVSRALQFDADNDGKLSREELLKMAEQVGPGFGRGEGGGARRPQPERPESDN